MTRQISHTSFLGETAITTSNRPNRSGSDLVIEHRHRHQTRANAKGRDVAPSPHNQTILRTSTRSRSNRRSWATRGRQTSEAITTITNTTTTKTMRGGELEAVRAGEEGVPGRDGAEAGGGVRGWRRRHGVRAVGAATLRCLLDIQLVGFRRPGTTAGGEEGAAGGRAGAPRSRPANGSASPELRFGASTARDLGIGSGRGEASEACGTGEGVRGLAIGAADRKSVV